jgi:cytochrome b
MSEQAEIKVWDPFVRISHWTLVVGIVAAFVTAEQWPEVHETIGYAIGVLLVFRIFWGFVGPQHARFSDFLRGPTAVRSYLVSLLAFKGRRYLGHSPAGGAMVVLLLTLLSVVVVTGIVSEEQREAAFGPVATMQAGTPPAVATGGQAKAAESLVGGIHEAAANLLIVLVPLHILGVLLASFVHRENLVAAMFTGRKRTKGKARDSAAGTR